MTPLTLVCKIPARNSEVSACPLFGPAGWLQPDTCLDRTAQALLNIEMAI